jgi:hypothetical protein
VPPEGNPAPVRIERAKYSQDRACKAAREGPYAQQTTRDVLQDLDWVLALRAAEDDPIG